MEATEQKEREAIFSCHDGKRGCGIESRLGRFVRTESLAGSTRISIEVIALMSPSTCRARSLHCSWLLACPRRESVTACKNGRS